MHPPPASTVRWTPARTDPQRRPSRHVPLEDGPDVFVQNVAAHRWTQQSSVDARGDGAFALPTAPELSPWWTIDLGRPLVVEALSLWLQPVPDDTTVCVTGYSFASPTGGPPVGCWSYETTVDALVAAEDGSWVLSMQADFVARFVRVQLRCPQRPAALHVLGLEVFAATVFAPTLLETFARAYTLFADRPLFSARARPGEGPFIVTHRYRDVWNLARTLAPALASRLERSTERVFLGLCTKNCPEWVIAELAALHRGYVVVALSPEDPDDKLRAIVERCPLDAVLCEPERVSAFEQLRPKCPTLSLIVDVRDRPSATVNGLETTCLSALLREAPQHVSPAIRREPSELFTLLFTSGSTGTPKGAMRSYEKFLRVLETYGVGQRGYHLSFQPLSHLSERNYLPATILHGAEVGFSSGGAHLLSDLAAFEPTWVSSVPRLFEVVHASYRRRLASAIAAEPSRDRAEIEREVLRSFRGVFGRRLQGVATGSAPVSDEVLAFLQRLFADLWVSDGYGSTELGTITGNHSVVDGVSVKIVPVDGLERSLGALERGELWVRSPHVFDGYFGDPDATRESMDSEGFFRTGDLVERRADGSLRVIGRRANSSKLANGEFVSLDRIESLLAGCPAVDRLVARVASGGRGVLAVVVPDASWLSLSLDRAENSLSVLVSDPRANRLVHDALLAHAAHVGLARYEAPTAIALSSERLSVANATLTASGKLARREANERFRAAFEQLESIALDRVDPSADRALDERRSLAERLAAIASAVTGRPTLPTDPLHERVAKDSLEVAEVLAAASDALGVELRVSWWSEARTLVDLANTIERGGLDPQHTDESLATQDLAIALPPAGPRRESAGYAIERVLLTGATGLVGAHVLESLLRETTATVRCLVRARSDDEARARVEATLSRFAIDGLDPARWSAFAADLAAPELALEAGSLEHLAHEFNAIVHAAAEVNWLDGYRALAPSNVHATLALLALAAHHNTPFHYVSTISTAPADGDEDSFDTLERARGGSGYGLSKWVAEAHVRRARDDGRPVTIHRPGLVTGHSLRGLPNPDDFVHRYLRACARYGVSLDRDERLDCTPVDYVSRAIVAFAREPSLWGRVTHLCNVDRSMTFRALGHALQACGVACTPVDYPRFRSVAALDRDSPLRPLSGYFGVQRFSLGSGPWPCERTRAVLEPRGIRAPAFTVEHVKRALRALGLLG